jgi:hypothetical protein
MARDAKMISSFEDFLMSNRSGRVAPVVSGKELTLCA